MSESSIDTNSITSAADATSIVEDDNNNNNNNNNDTGHEFEHMICDKSPIFLSFQNLTVETVSYFNPKSISKTLLNNVSGNITGGLCAVMGSSGSGKTTFLSALALRIDPFRMKVAGLLYMNGSEYNKHALKSMSCYVMQDDLVHPNFKVSEVLSFAAELRMSRTIGAAERIERVTYVMKLMGINHCRDVIVGDTRNKGISGGERKRLCIAMELLSKPSLLFLDEPTSGLDAVTALSLMETLHGISAKGYCTIICTIHQPQAKIFDLFDNLILMKKGSIMYQGARDKVVPYMQSLGCSFPMGCNPADQIIALIKDCDEESSDNHSRDDPIATHKPNPTRERVLNNYHSPALDDNSTDDDLYEVYKIDDRVFCDLERNNGTITLAPAPEKSKVNMLIHASYPHKVDLLLGSNKIKCPEVEFPTWYQQFCILFRRSIHIHCLRVDIILMNMLVTVLIAFFVSSSVWNDIGTSKVSASKRQAALFFCVIHQGIVASLQGTHSFPLERALMLRERAAGSYRVSAYFLAKTIADMSIQIISPLIFTVIVYPRIGFQASNAQFLIFLGVMILDNFAATSLANMGSCLFVSIEMATVVIACWYEICRLYGGWFISPALLKQYNNWAFADALSYIKYAFVAVSLNENESLTLTCTPSELSASGQCVISPINVGPYTGEAFNRYYGYDLYTIKFCVGMLIVYIVVCKIISYLALRFIKI